MVAAVAEWMESDTFSQLDNGDDHHRHFLPPLHFSFKGSKSQVMHLRGDYASLPHVFKPGLLPPRQDFLEGNKLYLSMDSFLR